ncbi:TIGR04222 domain-containing membrane protein [Streptomyces sp. 15-116A]|uniref:TIGR04222 domain-containing membrane protein n=1 Tax=Streptomyces sp. 15-116A TaxID=2259035 RepID=UPI0021B18D02|nr:TIGR04222 domain-containing membrane protein [Streptomyces sp. 15-116A]MCT7350809.1 TIGR04222 domain-containing membrane protein [Streptomyces sp. 15-116A]
MAGVVAYRLVVAVKVAVAMKADVAVREGLTVEELGCLAGGRRRVVTAVLARMHAQGRMSVIDGGDRVVLHDGAARGGVEGAVVKAAGVARSERAGKLVAEVARSGAVREVEERLCGEGLLVGSALLRKQYRARLLLWCAALLALAPTAYELIGGDPHLWWTGLALAVLAAAPAALVKPTEERVPHRVRFTLDLLRGERERPASSRPPNALTALAVTPTGTLALSGPAAVQDPELRALAAAETWRAGDRPLWGDSGLGTSAYGGGGGCGGGGSGGCGGGSQ